KPLLIARLVGNFLKIFILGLKPLRYVDFAVDYRCNLRCEHCFATTLEDNARRVITSDDFRRVANEAMRLGAVNFSFQGGEPTMLPKLSEFIKAASPCKNLISVTTNGTLLNEARVKELKGSGVDILTISLDSGIAQEHDSFRKMPGAFEKALNAARLAIKHGMNVTIGSTVSHQSIRSRGFLELIELTKQMNVLLFVALASPLGRWSKKEEVLLDDDDRKYLRGLLAKFSHVRTDFEANYVHYGCGAVKEILYITPYGDVMPCPFIHISFGNVKEESLGVIRERALRNRYFDKYYKKCIACERGQFMDEILPKVYESDQLPVSHNKVF
ncbi:MAG: radical SAM protein, partial [Candidatus Omnitrophota bacterium]